MAPSDAKLVKAGFARQRTLLDAQGINRALRRMAGEMVERNAGAEGLLLVGIRSRGVPLSDRLATLIGELEGGAPDKGILDITLYRDDVLHGLPDPEIKPTEIAVSVRDKTVVLVDDVLFTGRTVRAALDAIMDFGRPRRIELAVLVDRGNRELPIGADYVGLRLETDKATEAIAVQLAEFDDDEEGVLLYNRS